MAVSMFLPVPIEQEPKKMSRFVLEFPTELGIQSFLVQTSDKPKFDRAITEIPYINNFSYVSGHQKWSAMTIKLIDVIGPSTTQKIMEWARLGYEETTGRSGYAVGSAKNLVLKALDPTGVEVEKWTLVACLITAFDPGTYDMSSDDISTVSISFQPQNCILAA